VGSTELLPSPPDSRQVDFAAQRTKAGQIQFSLMNLWMPQVAGICNYKAVVPLEGRLFALLVSRARDLLSSQSMLTLEYIGELLEKHRADVALTVREFAIGGRTFAFNSYPAIMGVVNLSADSWYRESVCLTVDTAIRRGRVLQEQGADIIDIGAESTLAHAARLDEAGQNTKLLPVLREMRQAGILVSVETYHPQVTRACLEAGANVLNLTGTAQAAELYRMVADHDAAVIICYVQGRNVREVGEFDFGADPVNSMLDHFSRQIEIAERNGVRKILIDPGLGFYYRNLQDSAVRVRHQMTVFLNTFRLRRLGCPVCHALPHAFEYFGDEVRCAEPFFAVLAALGRTNLFRTHEVPRIKAVLETIGIF
jgi:dihydropteroate synthase